MGETSNPKTLKILTMGAIIASHSCFNELNNNNLLLPKRLFNELLEIGPGLIKMPVFRFWDDRFWFGDTEPFHKSLYYDQTYSKFFVVWVQQLISERMEKCMPASLIIHFLEIHFIIQIDNVESNHFLCTKCLKIYLNLNPIISNNFKIYRFYKHTNYVSFSLQRELQDKIQSPKSWCNMCRQVPLFQVADFNSCWQIVGESIHHCPLHYPVDDDDPEFIYCLNCYGTGFRRFFSFKTEITLSL